RDFPLHDGAVEVLSEESGHGARLLLLQQFAAREHDAAAALGEFRDAKNESLADKFRARLHALEVQLADRAERALALHADAHAALADFRDSSFHGPAGLESFLPVLGEVLVRGGG